MIKKLIDKLLGRGDAKSTVPAASKKAAAKEARGATGAPRPDFGKRHEIPYAKHGIDPDLVDKRALDVVRTLQDAGHEAYIVGGAVRDLLLGLRPKDFDVATDATPEQVKALFRRAFIIGRRFRIVHVVYGRGRQDKGLSEVIEVSTFRAYLDNAAAEQVKGNERTSKSELAGMKHAVDSSGRVLRDNVWGPQDEDATRRDFTINAMYYDPETEIVVDYHGGFKDAKKRVLRMIGDPAARYREDPVRIIRAVRFAAKLSGLGFKLEAGTGRPLKDMRSLLADVPQSRLFDEMLKLLQTGHALATVAQLEKLGLARGIYPLLDLVVERAQQPFVHAALEDTDRRVGEGKPVAPSFLLASVLWADVHDGWSARLKRQAPQAALQDAIDEVFDARIGDVSGRGKLGADMREIWLMQPRFDKRVGSSPYGLVEQPRFRAGFDFMRLRAEVGEVPVELADWWEAFSTASDAERDDLIAQARSQQQKNSQGRASAKSAEPRGGMRRAPPPEGTSIPARRHPDDGDDDEASDATPEGAASDLGDAADATAPAKKRRRRRRRPAGRREDGGPDPAPDGSA
ncbi:polynucleotide adenylyltransferase PcnB [Hylemonella gracilis]|uniref:Poly(A) polymerase I n=1 Tax=Hylemonella gracilis ATCC 19624 TaxID=887062 RepID=F3KPC6_9BURK|nr:polynucleotide adenylyltransferase PcnB [Hylemonella gracilis]EGI78367.1 poly(A) polymerase [Hylemonella gracilis ATCC 19624]